MNIFNKLFISDFPLTFTRIDISDQELRDRCMRYALFAKDDNMTALSERVRIAEHIYEFIKNGKHISLFE